MLLELKGLMRWSSIGLRLRVRARLRSGLCSSSSLTDSSTGCGVANRLRAADLVTGAKYDVSCDVEVEGGDCASISEGVGLGEITRVVGNLRVDGMAPAVSASMTSSAKGGSGGRAMRPAKARARWKSVSGQVDASVARCLSFLEARGDAAVVSKTACW